MARRQQQADRALRPAMRSPGRPMPARHVEPRQYTSWAFGHRLREAGLLGSMGSIGDCFDNGLAESFFATLQTELLDRHSWLPRATRQRRRLPRGLLQPPPPALRAGLPQPPDYETAGIDSSWRPQHDQPALLTNTVRGTGGTSGGARCLQAAHYEIPARSPQRPGRSARLPITAEREGPRRGLRSGTSSGRARRRRR